jgi:hypothetical protein
LQLAQESFAAIFRPSLRGCDSSWPQTEQPSISNASRARIAAYLAAWAAGVADRAEAQLRHIAEIYRSPRLCKAEVPSTLKGGDYVKSTNATSTTFTVTATGIVPALATCP